MRESAITKRIIDYIHSIGGTAIKVHGSVYMHSGTPDIIACVRGRFVAIEVKQPGKHPTPAQVAYIEKIQRSGGIAFVAHSVEEVDDLLAPRRNINRLDTNTLLS